MEKVNIAYDRQCVSKRAPEYNNSNTLRTVWCVLFKGEQTCYANVIQTIECCTFKACIKNTVYKH